MDSNSRGNGDDDVGVLVQDVLIDLNDNLKSQLVRDLSSICSVTEAEAKSMLEQHKWNMQVAIDTFLDSNTEEGSTQSDDDIIMLPTPPRSNRRLMDTVIIEDSPPEASGQHSEFFPPLPLGTGNGNTEKFSKLAPEKFSIISWNLDGLDEHNLEKRTDAVLSLIQKENHDIIFFQELIPATFDYIARKLASKYFPVIGTQNPMAQYFTATFLRHNKVYHDEDYIIPFPNTSMDRNLLVTKAFIGQAKLFLLNSHLESTKEFAAQRQAQLKICFDHCLAIPPEYNVIFGGDLNLRDKEVEGILPSSISDLWISCGSRETCQYTWDLTRNTNKQMPSKFQPRCRFDRLYFRHSPLYPSVLTPEFFGVTGIEKVEGTRSFPSDHWAILSFFRLSEEARQPTKENSTGGSKA